MKKIFAIIIIFLVFASCTKLEDLNKNIKDPTTVSGESLFTGAQKNLFDQMVSSNVNFNITRLIDQYWTETTYTDESNYDLVDRTIPDHHWDVLYRDVLMDLKESAKVIEATTYLNDASPAVKTARLKVVDVLAVYAWSILVESFGNIPYSEALDVTKLTPKYDDGLTIYKDLISRLSTDIAAIGAVSGSVIDGDNMYGGEAASWVKFANSLKLRMGMLLSKADLTYAKGIVEEAVSGGVFTSNGDNARLVYLSSQPNTNPIYNDLVASQRHDFVPANTIVDMMNTLSDPRRPYYFTLIDTSTVQGVVKLAYVGGVYGASNDFTLYSHVADKIQEPTFEALILDYAEVEFLLAEGVGREFAITGTAEEHYNKAISASIIYWGGTQGEADVYLANPDVAYTTAAGTYLEKIGKQFWLALYNRGLESWTEWRFLDAPVLTAPPDALSALPIRYTYPTKEQTLNGANYSAASTALGEDGDAVTTHLFWDKP
ncbi:MAG: SusD/RagB family nutrient-binding outer membrane lipoprotein [Bacteroidetes bacterium]|nr:SusD/RagB family nutrient-binding outer membrane lipoprotein [Bacteroidota bacterium]